jgi:hypothetical protein
MVPKCFGMNVITAVGRSLLILVALECFERYKIDYIQVAESMDHLKASKKF